jgi:cytochrome c-type biogenesis protein
MSDYPSIILTFAAGFLSFFTPCVLPLIPSYLSILGGAAGLPSTDDEQANKKRFILLITTLCFILGFTVVFIIFSIIISATLLLMGGVGNYVRIVAGIIVIILGINYIFDFLAILNYEKRFHPTKPQGLIGAFFAGMAFGAGWTPCIGPVLTGVLFLAGQSGTTGVAAMYLALYSIGLGLPFLLAALFFDRYLVPAKWFREKLPLIKKISGCLLIVIGLLIITNRFSMLNIALQRLQFQFIFWAEDKTLPFRVLANWLNMHNM